MSVTSGSKCVFCTFTRSVRQKTPAFSRSFSSSPGHHARKPKFASIKAPRANIKKVPPMTPEYLEQNFSPEQRAAIEAANKVVNNDKIQQVQSDRHPWSMNYVDNLTHIDPIADHPVRAPWTNIDDSSRLKTSEEIDEDFYNFMKTMPDDEDKAVEAWKKFDENMRLTVGREEVEKNPRTALAPDLRTMPSKTDTGKAKGPKGSRDAKKQEEISPDLLRLLQMTGFTAEELRALRIKTLVSRRVANQTRLGKIYKMSILSVAGNGNGLVGIGIGKAEEGSEAIVQSQHRAIRSMLPILRYEDRTIFGDVEGKSGATELELYARPPGFGVRCSQHIFEIARAAGITDLSARVTRARNPMNVVKATIKALHSQKDPEEIAKARGKKLVDVRKVYYANQV